MGSLFDLVSLVQAGGYLGLFLIIFAESGLFLGFFLPGDSLLFTAGFLASQGYLNIVALIAVAFFGAVLGDSFGYFFGKKVGPKIFTREDSFFFHKDHIDRARMFYERYGGKAIILARFMRIVRPFAPVLAGVGKMRYSLFFFYNVVGGVLWAIGVTALGYYLGNTIPGVDRYIIPIVALIIVSSVAPPLYHVLKKKESRERFFGMLRKGMRRFFAGR